MATAIDFSKYELNGKYYGGSERKEGISIDGDDYMIKFQKSTKVVFFFCLFCIIIV